MKTKLFIKTISKDKDKNCPVYCRIIAGRNFDQTAKAQRFVKAEHWNPLRQELRQLAEIPDKDNFNKDLRNLKNFVESEFNKVPDKENTPKDWLKNTIDRFWNPDKYKNKPITLFDFITDFIEQSATRLTDQGKRLNKHRIYHYKQAFESMKEFAGKKTIDFKDIDQQFYYDFLDFLQEKGLSTNTIGARIKNLKLFLNAAKEAGHNPYEIYKNRKFKSVSEDSENIYLTNKELEKLFSLNLNDKPRLERVRDLFLIGCWTGLRFSDLHKITPENIQGDYISIKQTKTGKPVTIPLHPTVKALISKYGGILPKPISNQKFNAYIKQVVMDAKINETVHKAITQGGINKSKAYKKHELVTSHTARRSFATNLYKAGFPSISLMQITGHKTEKAFLTYIKVTNEEHARRLHEFWNENKEHLKVV